MGGFDAGGTGASTSLAFIKQLRVAQRWFPHTTNWWKAKYGAALRGPVQFWHAHPERLSLWPMQIVPLPTLCDNCMQLQLFSLLRTLRSRIGCVHLGCQYTGRPKDAVAAGTGAANGVMKEGTASTHVDGQALS